MSRSGLRLVVIFHQNADFLFNGLNLTRFWATNRLLMVTMPRIASYFDRLELLYISFPYFNNKFCLLDRLFVEKPCFEVDC